MATETRHPRPGVAALLGLLLWAQAGHGQDAGVPPTAQAGHAPAPNSTASPDSTPAPDPTPAPGPKAPAKPETRGHTTERPPGQAPPQQPDGKPGGTVGAAERPPTRVRRAPSGRPPPTKKPINSKDYKTKMSPKGGQEDERIIMNLEFFMMMEMLQDYEILDEAGE